MSGVLVGFVSVCEGSLNSGSNLSFDLGDV